MGIALPTRILVAAAAIKGGSINTSMWCGGKKAVELGPHLDLSDGRPIAVPFRPTETTTSERAQRARQRKNYTRKE